ncbi:MAG: helix-turn-helix domain-containing protein [Sphingobacteriaceae bacterium]|nr:helix-turn-helix domain-containing protein [Sphingobacteriaceae bacterium]
MSQKKSEILQKSNLNLDDDTMLMEDVCAYLKCSPSTVDKYVAQGKFPAPRKILSRKTWIRAEVVDWRNKQLHN